MSITKVLLPAALLAAFATGCGPRPTVRSGLDLAASTYQCPAERVRVLERQDRYILFDVCGYERAVSWEEARHGGWITASPSHPARWSVFAPGMDRGPYSPRNMYQPSGIPAQPNDEAEWSASTTDAWRVTRGELMHWDGRFWSYRKSPSDKRLQAIWGAAPDAVWVGGEAGVYFWNGSAWHGPELDANVRAIWGSAADDVWVTASYGSVFHYDGTRWTERKTEQCGFELEAIAGSGKDDVWLGDDSCPLIHWDGSTWTSTYDGVGALSLWSGAPDDVWAGGRDGALAHWDGKVWTKHQAPLERDVMAIRGTRDRLVATDRDGAQAVWNGTAWAKPAAPVVDWRRRARWYFHETSLQDDLHAVWTAGDGRVFAVGDNGRFGEFMGGADTIATDTKVALRAVAGAGKHAWAVGDGGIVLEWNGVHAITHRPVGTTNLMAVWISPSGTVWVAGEAGTIARYSRGRWTTITTGKHPTLAAIWGTSDSDLWLAGEFGVILHGDGTKLTMVASGTSEHLRAISGKGAAVWAVGEHGTIVRWDGAAWSAVDAHTTHDLHAVAVNERDVWIAGAHGTLLHHDGNTFAAIELGVDVELRGLTAPSAEHVLAVSKGAMWSYAAR